jgi:hypothetical protein
MTPNDYRRMKRIKPFGGSVNTPSDTERFWLMEATKAEYLARKRRERANSLARRFRVALVAIVAFVAVLIGVRG